MSLLSDLSMRAAIDRGDLAITPFDQTMVQPSSLDVRLDDTFLVFNNNQHGFIDPAIEQPDLYQEVKAVGAFILHPGEFVLAATYEAIGLGYDLAARMEGKALALDTLVPTPSGWRTMGDLRVGDLVFDRDGSARLVSDATPVMHGRPCFEVTFSDGSTFIADESHLWLTSTKADRRAGRAESARTTKEIAAELHSRLEYNHHVAAAAPVQYPDAALPLDPYVLGAWLGDGTAAKAEVTIGSGDEQILREIQMSGHVTWAASNVLSYRVGGTERYSERLRDGLGRFAPDDSLSSTLRGMGLLGNKHVPAAYLRAGVGQRLALLQGLMDTDGHVDIRGRCEFSSSTQALAEAVFELTASLGLRPKRSERRAIFDGRDYGPHYRVKFTPRGTPVFRLARKLGRQRPGFTEQSRSVVSVRPVESVPVRCIEVSSSDGSFLIGEGFVPTHNSSLGRLGLLTHATAGFIDPGFVGHITLELSNVANLPLKLYPGMKIGQLCFFQMSTRVGRAYGSSSLGSRYQGQRGPTASRSWQNFRSGFDSGAESS